MNRGEDFGLLFLCKGAGRPGFCGRLLGMSMKYDVFIQNHENAEFFLGIELISFNDVTARRTRRFIVLYGLIIKCTTCIPVAKSNT